MLAPNSSDTKVEEESFFVIVVTHSKDRWEDKKYLGQEEYHAYFKSDRYSVYSGNLQTDFDVAAARHWKTKEGAAKALSRLIEGSVIKKHNKPVVCRYSRTVTRTESLVTIEEDPSCSTLPSKL